MVTQYISSLGGIFIKNFIIKYPCWVVVAFVSLFSCLIACLAVPIIATASTNPIEVVAMLVLIPTLIISIVASAPVIYYYRKIVFENKAIINQLNKDPLTGLLNRHSFYPQFIDNLKVLQDQEKSYALLMIDIDDFKRINDSHGHLVGDQVLQEANRISQALVHSLESQIQLDNLTIHMTASIGMIYSNSNSLDSDSLVMEADKKMYKAKTSGKNQLAHKVIA